jgi:peptidoglycan-associated lipoprotein
MNKYVVILAILLIGALPLLAQSDFPRAQVFGGYSYVRADTHDVLSGPQNLNGWNAQGSVNFNKWLGITADFGGYYGSPGQVTIHDYSFLFGPTLTYRTEHVAPFFHALFGGNHINASILGFPGSDTAFAMAFGGGLDLPVGEHFGVRLAQVDWLRTQHFSSGQNNIRFSTGIMFNFGK